MTTAPAPTFHHPITISPQEIDAMGHVNNAVYLHWVQEAVVQYWQHQSPPQAQGSWCCVDAITRRPRRIADDIARAFLPAKAEGTAR